MTCKRDPAMAIIDALSDALADAFTGTACPPLVGNVTDVRFFAGDGAPMAAVDTHLSQGCDAPFVWVRAMRRYRAEVFPNPTVDTNPCGCALIKVLAAEVGVGFCAVVDQEPTWQDYATEAAASMDAAWRIERSLENAASVLKAQTEGRQVGTDIIVPYGPEGGIIAWTGVMYASFD